MHVRRVLSDLLSCSVDSYRSWQLCDLYYAMLKVGVALAEPTRVTTSMTQHVAAPCVNSRVQLNPQFTLHACTLGQVHLCMQRVWSKTQSM